MNRGAFADKVIILTGASGGIGGAVAQELSFEGARLCLCGRNQKKLTDLKTVLSDNEHKIYELDLSNEESIKNCVLSTVTDFGRIDGFVHAAGFELTKPVRKTKKEDFLNLFEINTVSAFSFIREILKQKKAIQGYLSFVIISSVMGLLGERGKIAYCASKGALNSAVKALALEIAPKHHRINCLSPGMVNTELTRSMMSDFSPDLVKAIEDQHPLGFGKPEDVAHAVLFLLSENSGWITGSNLIIDGGYSAR